MIEIVKGKEGNIIQVTLSGKLVKKDYERFVPEIEEIVAEHGKIRILVIMKGFKGWSAGALWEDIKLVPKFFRDIERLALVGEKRWEKGMASFCKPFTSAEVRYFGVSELEEAEAWVSA